MELSTNIFFYVLDSLIHANANQINRYVSSYEIGKSLGGAQM